MNGKLVTGIVVLLMVLGAGSAILSFVACSSSDSTTDPGDGSSHHAEVQTIEAEIDCIPLQNTLPTSVKICVNIENLVDSPRVVDARIDLWLGGDSPVRDWRFRAVDLPPNGMWEHSWINQLMDLQSLEDLTTARLRVVDVTPPPYNQPPYPSSGYVAEDVCFFWGVRP